MGNRRRVAGAAWTLSAVIRLGATRVLLVAVLYGAATVYFTWALPQVADDHIFKTVTAQDLLLIIWILRWDIHALATDPLHLFEGNALHPARHVLAASEHLLGDLPIFAPVWALTQNPVLTLNVLTLSSFVLASVFMHFLVRSWSGSTAAAFVGGLAFAFAPWRIPDGIGRPHLLQVQYFPLILLGLERTARSASFRAGVLTASVITLQALCSYYIAYQAYVLAGVFVIADLIGHGVRGRRRALLALAIGVLSPMLVLVPLSLPYLALRAAGELRYQPLPAAVDLLKLVFANPLIWVVRWYVGWGTLTLGVLALPLLARRWSNERRTAVRMLAFAGIAAAGFVLAPGSTPIFGDHFAPFTWLEPLVPGFRNIRAPVRFGALASFGMSGLAAYTAAGLVRWVGRQSRSRWSLAAVGVVAAAGVLQPMFRTPRLAGAPVPVGASIPPVYRWLALHGEGQPLLELPMRAWAYGGLAMYFSTYHWLPILNGHTGYLPSTYEFLQNYANQLPNAEALRLLVDCSNVRWILVHYASRARLRAWNSLRGVRLRGVFPRRRPGLDRLYEVTARARSGCMDRLFQREETVQGLPVRAPPTLAGTLSATLPARGLTAGVERLITVTVENTGTTTWPCTNVRRAGRVALSMEWRSGGKRIGQAREVFLPTDVVPGAPMRLAVWLRPPPQPGRYVLSLHLGAGSRGTLAWEQEVTVNASPS